MKKIRIQCNNSLCIQLVVVHKDHNICRERERENGRMRVANRWTLHRLYLPWTKWQWRTYTEYKIIRWNRIWIHILGGAYTQKRLILKIDLDAHTESLETSCDLSALFRQNENSPKWENTHLAFVCLGERRHNSNENWEFSIFSAFEVNG